MHKMLAAGIETVFHGSAFILAGIALAIVVYNAIQEESLSKRRAKLMVFNRDTSGRHQIRKIKAQEQMGFKLGMRHAIEKKYLIQTGIWQHCPFIKLRHLVGVSLLCGVVLGNWVWHLFEIEGLVLSGFFLGMLLPLQVLELFKMHRSYQLTCALPSFYGILLRWAQIQPDIYFCFGQLSCSGLPIRLTKPFDRFLKESTSGVSKEMAFEQLFRQFEGSPLQNFLKCLERLIDHRGDLPKLLQGFEEEAYQLQHEVTKRKMVQVKYKLLINGLCASAFVLIYSLLKTNRVLSSFYVNTVAGKTLLSILAGLFVLSFLGGLHYDED